MSKVSRKIALFGFLGIFCLGGFAADQKIADGSRPTGLKPIDAAQYQKIRETWPRVTKVHANQLGLERINAHRALQGKPALEVSTVKAIGQEIESSIVGTRMSVQAALPNAELLGQLPTSVDNSLPPMPFPPVGDQGYLNACLPFATTYYQLSYMSALMRVPQTLTLYSPKWTYNMINGGADGGSYPTDAYALLEKHGAATLAEFPYDSNYRGWCLTPSAWRNALSVRTHPVQYLDNASSASGIESIKELLTNGYILVFGTYIMSWQGQLIMEDGSYTYADEVGKAIGYFLNGELGSHAMTIVGYDDAIWADVNGNTIVDPGEKGAFKIANSWGDTWQDEGFIWLAYDALRSVSAIPDGPTDGRTTAFQQDAVFVMTPRVDYSPSMIAEFTLNHAKRGQMGITLGVSDTSSTLPTAEWYPAALAWQGGAYAFDGSTTAVDGTFVLDFTDLLSESGVERKFYLGLWDNVAGDIATLKTFKIVDLTTEPDTDSGSITTLPITADGSAEATYAFTQYTYTGATGNHRPLLSESSVSPPLGIVTDTYHYQVHYTDPDGDSVAIHSIYIDDVQHDMIEFPTSPGYFYYDTTLSVGTHNFRFYFTDGRGGVANEPAAGTYSGPVVTLAHFVGQPARPHGNSLPVLGTSYMYSTDYSACSEAHDIQYRFDWGDGTFSDWLSVGPTSASHAWTASGSFAVKAQARCAFEISIVSPWSEWLLVMVPAMVPFTESFMSSGFPAGWIQQNFGEDVYNGWALSPSVNAGGQAYEMACTFEDVVPGETNLVTPPINTIGYTQLRLRFKHFLKAWTTGGAVLKIRTSTDRVNWTDEAWTVTTTTDNIGPETVDTTLTHNLGSETTFVAFSITGDLYYFDYWYIDDVEIASISNPKVDFNNDGQEDILWRYYGAGGYNRAWFLGNTEPIGLQTSASDFQMGSSRASAVTVGNNASGRSTKVPRNMGIFPGKQKRSSPKAPRNLMGAVKRSAVRTRVADPRRVGGGDFGLSPKGFTDPRQVRPDSLTAGLSGAPIELASTPAVLGGGDVLPVDDVSWQIVGTGDFNNDTHVDILWRNASSGINVVWFMNGTDWAGSAELLPVADLSWQIVGTGDFNKDTHVDILWRNSATGDNVVWYMNGTNWAGSAFLLGVSDQNWRIVGTGDFNKDGNVDLLWRYSGAGGYNVVWYLENTTWTGSAELIPVGDTTWQIVATGDYNRDGNVDLLWRYNGAGGYNVIWYMNGVAWSESAELLSVNDLTWRIVSR